MQDGLETNKTSSEVRTITRQQNERVESWERIENPGGQRAQSLEDQNCEGERHSPGVKCSRVLCRKVSRRKGTFCRIREVKEGRVEKEEFGCLPQPSLPHLLPLLPEHSGHRVVPYVAFVNTESILLPVAQLFLTWLTPSFYLVLSSSISFWKWS